MALQAGAPLDGVFHLTVQTPARRARCWVACLVLMAVAAFCIYGVLTDSPWKWILLVPLGFGLYMAVWSIERLMAARLPLGIHLTGLRVDSGSLSFGKVFAQPVGGPCGRWPEGVRITPVSWRESPLSAGRCPDRMEIELSHTSLDNWFISNIAVLWQGSRHCSNLMYYPSRTSPLCVVRQGHLTSLRSMKERWSEAATVLPQLNAIGRSLAESACNLPGGCVLRFKVSTNAPAGLFLFGAVGGAVVGAAQGIKQQKVRNAISEGHWCPQTSRDG